VVGVLLLLSALGGAIPCSYRRSGEKEIAPQGGCAIRAPDGSLRIDRRHLGRLDFGIDGMAAVFVEGRGWAYVRRDGRTLEVPEFDNGPDDFSEGLVRIRRDGKTGYADRSFRTVIRPRFDDGWPFDGGRALVCIGCRLAPPDPRHDEHRPVSGGAWGFIDRTGREVVPIRYSREEALAKGRNLQDSGTGR